MIDLGFEVNLQYRPVNEEGKSKQVPYLYIKQITSEGYTDIALRLKDNGFNTDNNSLIEFVQDFIDKLYISKDTTLNVSYVANNKEE
jgi:hypothetical protein